MSVFRKKCSNGRREVVVCLCLLIVSLALAQAQQQPSSSPPAAGLEQQGRDLLRNDNPLQAKEVLEKAVGLRPGSANAWSMLAAAYSQLGLAEEATRSYEQVLKLNPISPNALYNLGILHLHRNHFQQAVGYLQAFRQRQPEDREALLPLAHCLMKLGRVAEGQRVIDEALCAAKDSTELSLKSGQLLLTHGLVKDAVKPLEAVLRVTPGSAEARLSLALAESRLGHHTRVVELLLDHPVSKDSLYLDVLGSSLTYLERFHEAVALLEQALGRHPEEKSIYLNLALAYAKTQHPERALEVLLQARSRWPEDLEIKSRLAHQLFLAGDPAAAEYLLRTAPGPKGEGLDLLVKCYVALGQMADAERAAERALKEGGPRESALLALANVLQLQKRDPEVITLLERHRQEFHLSSRFLFTLGLSYLNMGNYSQARELLEKVVSLDPSLAQAYHLLGNCSASVGDQEGAVSYYQAALRLSPEHFLFNFQLGLVLSKLGRKDEAEKYLARSIQLEPSHAPARYELASIYFDTSRFESALQQLRKAIEVDPEFESSYYLISRVQSGLGQKEEAALMMKRFQEIQKERRDQARALKEPKYSRAQP